MRRGETLSPSRTSTAAAFRQEVRAGRFAGPTAGRAPGFVQANLVALPASHARDFEAFCRSNAQACPIVDVTRAGDPHPAVAPGADLRTDVPRYQVFRDGRLSDEPGDVTTLWQDDMVAFLLGCSFTFEHALLADGIPLRHIAENLNVAMYRTTVPCTSAGPFRGELVVSMRPLDRDRVDRARQICAAMPMAHGAPLHVGDPHRLGIADLDAPDFGDAVEIRDGEVPVFWACGVTGTEAAKAAAPPLTITHCPGHMFVTDLAIGRSRVAEAGIA
jgi:uncharacterized protein YcsI (UPF0317 family)